MPECFVVFVHYILSASLFGDGYVRQEQMLGAIEHPTVPLPSAQLMFAHQLSVVATSLRVACHSPARNIRISQLYRDHSARQDQLNRQNRQDDLSITTSVYL